MRRYRQRAAGRDVPRSEAQTKRLSSAAFSAAAHHGFAAKPVLYSKLTVLSFAISFLFTWFTSLAQQSHPASSLSDLQLQLSNHVSQEKFASALWGVKIVSLETGKVLFEHNTRKLFSPASNSKLYTVALGLDRLGADYRIKTSLYSAARPNRWGTIKGDLVVYGRGDATINARLHHEDIYAALEPLISALIHRGVKRIAGDIVADESFFHGPPYGSGWAWDDMQYYYGAEISALTINDNTLQVLVNPAAKIGEPCKLMLSPATSLVCLSNQTRTATEKTKCSIAFHLFLKCHVKIHSAGLSYVLPFQVVYLLMH
jgi:D-alanyl-D-alanine carboxypeptidase/D-alanyl-D-alanine-endopeptidase (penicillin-binding protein 4)